MTKLSKTAYATGRGGQTFDPPLTHYIFFFFGGGGEPFLYGLNTHTLSVRRSKDTYYGGPRPEAFAQVSQAT